LEVRLRGLQSIFIGLQSIFICRARHNRKDRLFLGNDEAGPRAAVLCTIIAAAKRHRLEALAYLREVILQLSVDSIREYLETLLPAWALGHPEHVLNYRVE
jgi:transposase